MERDKKLDAKILSSNLLRKGLESDYQVQVGTLFCSASETIVSCFSFIICTSFNSIYIWELTPPESRYSAQVPYANNSSVLRDFTCSVPSSCLNADGIVLQRLKTENLQSQLTILTRILTVATEGSARSSPNTNIFLLLST